FEPSIDYVVAKVPRFAFEKFAGAERQLGTSMKSVGEAMAIGRTFKEAIQKALRSLEIGRAGLTTIKPAPDMAELEKRLRRPAPEQIFYVRHALERGLSIEKVHELTSVDPWFLRQIRELVDFEKELSKGPLDARRLRKAKELGYSDAQIADATKKKESAVRAA